jgi:hypothetical protein
MNFPVNVNGQVYSWGDLTCLIAGVIVTGITGIDYKEEQATEPVYGAGNRQTGYYKGKITNTGSLTLQKEELEALQKASVTGRLQDLPEFNVVVSFLTEDGKMANHTLKYCRFKNNGRSMSEGNGGIVQQIDLMIGEIVWK